MRQTLNGFELRKSPQSDRAGFSILEVLITVIIIGVLASIMVPNLARRAEEGKIEAARMDLRELAEAEARVAISLNYYVPQHVLNDLVWGPDMTSDAIIYEENNPRVAPSMGTRIFIDKKSGDFLDANYSQNLFDQMVGNIGATPQEEDVRRRVEQRFKGPYINWERDTNRDDQQEDPWGNPYLMFIREGMVWDYDAPYDNSVDWDMQSRRIRHEIIRNWDPVTYQNTGVIDCQVFDRFVFLSMGPNGVPGGTDPGNLNTYQVFGEDDDLVMYF